MELRQRLTRWQTRVRNFHWGRQNKQLLTGTVVDGETTDSNSTQFLEEKQLASKFRWQGEDSASQPNTGRSALNPMKRILRHSKAECLVESEDKSPSPAANSGLNPSSASILNKNGTKLPRYAKLTNLAVPEQSTHHNTNHHHPLPHHQHNHNHQLSSIQPLKQKKAKIVSPKWNKITHALCNSKRLKVSKTPRLMSSGEASWHEEEEEKREEFHTYAFDNAALDLRNHASEKPVA